MSIVEKGLSAQNPKQTDSVDLDETRTLLYLFWSAGMESLTTDAQTKTNCNKDPYRSLGKLLEGEGGWGARWGSVEGAA